MMRNRWTAALLAAVAVGAAGCAPGKVSGGGWIASSSGSGKANFGFAAARCQVDGPIDGSLNYHDKNAVGYQGGVKFVATPVRAGKCDEVVQGGDIVIGCALCLDLGVQGGFGADFTYTSTNPRHPGSGNVFGCFVDNGEGQNAPADLVRYLVDQGPYSGYANMGTVQGNVQRGDCTCTDGLDNDGDLLVDADDPSCQDPVTFEYNPNLDEDTPNLPI